MRALNNFVIIKEIAAPVKRTGGGLELTQDHLKDERGARGEVVSVGDMVQQKLECCEVVVYDKLAGFNIDYEGEVFKVIKDRDVIYVEEV